MASILTRRCSPFKRFGFLPLGGRSVAIKLSDGTVWVLASTPPDDGTRKEIDSLGTVAYVVSPNSEHHFFLGRPTLLEFFERTPTTLKLLLRTHILMPSLWVPQL